MRQLFVLLGLCLPIGIVSYSKVLDLNSAILAPSGENEPSTLFSPYNRFLNRGPAAFSLQHQFNANFSYQLPFGNGQRFGGSASGWVNQLIGGWQWNGIINAQGGFPMTPVIGFNNSGTGDEGQPRRTRLESEFPRESDFGAFKNSVAVADVRKSYRPGGTASRTNRPLASVVTLFTNPRLLIVTIAIAPATGEPSCETCPNSAVLSGLARERPGRTRRCHTPLM